MTAKRRRRRNRERRRLSARTLASFSSSLSKSAASKFLDAFSSSQLAASARTAALQLGLPKRPKLSMRAAATNEAELKGLNREFLSIALPAVVQFAAEPVARLVDTYRKFRRAAEKRRVVRGMLATKKKNA